MIAKKPLLSDDSLLSILALLLLSKIVTAVTRWRNITSDFISQQQRQEERFLSLIAHLPALAIVWICPLRPRETGATALRHGNEIVKDIGKFVLGQSQSGRRRLCT